MDTSKIKHWLTFGVVLLFIVGWSVTLYFYQPKTIVEHLGVQNSYLMAFLISVLGALSSFTTFSTYPAIYALAAGKVDPLALGLISGLGLAIGDILFFYFGFTARGVVTENFKEKLRNILKWLTSRSRWLLSLFIFFYVGFTPFPNNILTGALALIGYPFKKVWIPLTLGDMVLPTAAAFLSFYGVDFLFQ